MIGSRSSSEGGSGLSPRARTNHSDIDGLFIPMLIHTF